MNDRYYYDRGNAVNGWFWTILLLPITLPIAILMSFSERRDD